MIRNHKLFTTLEIAELHAKRLKYAIQKLNPMIPISAKRFSDLTEDEIPIFELFTSRFSKLQDLMDSKLFALVLEYSKEPGQFETFLDKLNALEKLGCVNAKQWLELREMRNHLSHEYPEHPEISADNINRAYDMANSLLKIFQNLILFVNKIDEKL